MKPFIEHAFDLAVHELDEETRGTPFKYGKNTLVSDGQKAKLMNGLIQAFIFGALLSKYQ